jgi:hypothetical protein
MKTRGSLTHSHERHSLASLSQRIMLSPAETLAVVGDGKLLALGEKINGGYAFSTHALDALRSETVNLISRTICNELARRGASETVMLAACSRAFEKQFELARGQGESLVEFANNDDDDGFYQGVKKGAGVTAGAAGAAGLGYLGYRAWRNRQRNGSTPQLPGPGGSGPDADYIDIPSPRPSGGSGGTVAGVERHPDPVGPPRLTTASPTPDLLADAVRKGRMSIAKRGSSILAALRGAV